MADHTVHYSKSMILLFVTLLLLTLSITNDTYAVPSDGWQQEDPCEEDVGNCVRTDDTTSLEPLAWVIGVLIVGIVAVSFAKAGIHSLVDRLTGSTPDSALGVRARDEPSALLVRQASPHSQSIPTHRTPEYASQDDIDDYFAGRWVADYASNRDRGDQSEIDAWVTDDY